MNDDEGDQEVFSFVEDLPTSMVKSVIWKRIPDIAEAHRYALEGDLETPKGVDTESLVLDAQGQPLAEKSGSGDTTARSRPLLQHSKCTNEEQHKAQHSKENRRQDLSSEKDDAKNETDRLAELEKENRLLKLQLQLQMQERELQNKAKGQFPPGKEALTDNSVPNLESDQSIPRINTPHEHRSVKDEQSESTGSGSESEGSEEDEEGSDEEDDETEEGSDEEDSEEDDEYTDETDDESGEESDEEDEEDKTETAKKNKSTRSEQSESAIEPDSAAQVKSPYGSPSTRSSVVLQPSRIAQSFLLGDQKAAPSTAADNSSTKVEKIKLPPKSATSSKPPKTVGSEETSGDTSSRSQSQLEIKEEFSEKKMEKFMKMRNKKIEEDTVRKEARQKKKKKTSLYPPPSPCPSSSALSREEERAKRGTTSAGSASRSNKKLIRNAISHVCLAGAVNEKEKNTVLDFLDNHDGENYIVMLRDEQSPVYKGLYTVDLDSTPPVVVRILGSGPKQLEVDMIELFFKYDSGGKKFRALPTKNFNISTDGVCLSAAYLKRLKQLKAGKKESE